MAGAALGYQPTSTFKPVQRSGQLLETQGPSTPKKKRNPAQIAIVIALIEEGTTQTLDHVLVWAGTRATPHRERSRSTVLQGTESSQNAPFTAAMFTACVKEIFQQSM
jgi:hypothetical protein